MIRPTIGLDWDDVIAPFNSLACEMLNEELSAAGRNDFVSIYDIDSWNNTGKASGIKKFYQDKRLYERQTARVLSDSIRMVRELMEIADVYIITAAFPQFMSFRALQIMEVFPEIDQSHIILGAAKNMVHFDFVLDDNINNVLDSPAAYPVLFRKPWNANMTGLLSVNSLVEFVSLVRNVMAPINIDQLKKKMQSFVVALVGPSGSGKNQLADLLMDADTRFARPMGFTTNPRDNNVYRSYVSEREFREKVFLEKTRYAGFGYGIEKESVADMLRDGKYPVVPIDICGAVGMKMHYPTLVVYIKRSKCEIVRDIISDHSLSEDEKALRILSLEAERKNETICDLAVDYAVVLERVLELLPDAMVLSDGEICYEPTE